MDTFCIRMPRQLWKRLVAVAAYTTLQEGRHVSAAEVVRRAIAEKVQQRGRDMETSK
jgi:hypothetical protein